MAERVDSGLTLFLFCLYFYSSQKDLKKWKFLIFSTETDKDVLNVNTLNKNSNSVMETSTF